MKFAVGRTSQSQQPVAEAPGSAASAALQQSSRQQQQARQLQALKHGNAALIQHKPDESIVSQQAALEDEEPVQGKFETAQKMGLEDEEPMQGKFDATVQRQPDEEEPLQGKFEPGAVNQRQADAAPANNTGMPDQLKSGIESLSGYAMDDVKVHYNSAKPAAMQAHAYAQGTDIHIAPGQEQHLPHEAWHVVQQKQGRVQATTQLKGEAINDDPGLEHEADVMGAKAMSSAPASTAIPQLKATLMQRAAVAQMAWIPIINNSARRHYNDGWGDLYDITSDADLEDEVEHNGPVEDGEQRIDLGSYAHAGEHLVRPCYVVFSNWQGNQGDDMSTIFHCGPGNG